jgi:para-aminobenzoate synthetase/4-amino-4-deoxychorismate lyase
MTISVLIDDSRSRQARSYLFEGPSAVIEAFEASAVTPALDEMERRLAAGAHLAGFFAYELGYVLEPRLGALLPQQRDVPLLWFGVFDAPAMLDHAGVDQLLGLDREGQCRISDFDVTMAREDYRSRFGRVKSLIAAGDIYQLNLTFKARFDYKGPAKALYARLREKQPVAHAALIETPDFAVISASPELFLEIDAGKALTRPMKGTARRGVTLEQDRELAQWLHDDPKSRAENLMIVDLMRNDLGRVCETGSVTVSDLFTVETFETLHQMTSGVRGTLRGDVDLAQLAASVLPPGSVTGAPKLRAVEIIRELEAEPRGVYTGAIGMFGPDGAARFNVAIRTLTLFPDGRGEIGIGSGVVQDSQADDEYDECLLKMKFLSHPPRSFQLIETMRFDSGQGVYLLDRHLERLGRSAAYFGYPFDRAEVACLIEREVEGLAAGPHRVRLLLNKSGRASLTSVAMAAPAGTPAGTPAMRYAISEHRIDSADVFLFHKTTVREIYDGEHARYGEQYGCDEVLFLNERGELAEGSRTNIFVERDGVLATPALDCGLLPGTLRAELLASGQAREAALFPRDLEAGNAVYLGNSVRGLVRAEPIEIPISKAAGGAKPAPFRNPRRSSLAIRPKISRSAAVGSSS